MVTVKINGNPVDLNPVNLRSTLSASRSSTSTSDYVLIQAHDDLSKDEQSQLEGLGVQIQEYVGSHVYLCRCATNHTSSSHPSSDYSEGNSEDHPGTHASISNLPFVTHVRVYHPALKAHATLKSKFNQSTSANETVCIVLHQDKDVTAEQVADRIADEANISRDSIHIDGNKIKCRIQSNHLSAVSAIDSVRTIEISSKRVLHNNIASQIMNADINMSNVAYRGAGQTVAIADTGLDTGNVDTIHPAFHDRIAALIPIGRDTATDDTEGHGTHVSGSAVGGLVPGDDQLVKGIASEAKIVMQSLTNDQGGLFPATGYPLYQLFTEPYQKYQAYVHSNSWGADWAGVQQPYDDDAREIDQAMWDNPELLICFASGNDGDKSEGATVGSQAAAKNCLTVGASESLRPSSQGVFSPLKKSDNDATEISWYSNRGPTVEGRIKPDVVAPGTPILSVKSSAAPFSTAFGVSPSKTFMFMSGTSMATPLVAGCAAVLRGYLIGNGVDRPSAALIKALLINGAFSMHHAHSCREGFGRVDLRNSIISPHDGGSSGLVGFKHGDPLADRGQQHVYKVMIPKGDVATRPGTNGINGAGNGHEDVPRQQQQPTLKATLVYTDAPGAALQNNLNLSVTTADGASRHGNMGSSSAFDAVNNVEQVVWRQIPAGEARLTVRAARITTSRSQDYALVWSVV
ncbi:hypothetical protein ANO11243_090870 [Dothideomycetidae sp. 11243]|nr:hypothetical protein ANO11243_090870 [fungal sp. No.11243]